MYCLSQNILTMLKMMMMVVMYEGSATSSTPSAMPLNKVEVILTVPRLMCSCRPQQ